MQTIGERLAEARKKKGATLREAAEATKIRGDFIQKFEGNQFDIGLAELYVRGFLRVYANYLHVPAERIVSDYEALTRNDARPRQPAREVYGRMDLSISHAGASDDSRQATADEGGDPGPQAERPRAQFPRKTSQLPREPFMDPATVTKVVKWGGGIAVIFVAVWIWVSVRDQAGSARRAGAAAPSATDAVAPAEVSVIATQPIHVTVSRQSDGAELFQGDLAAGERREFPNVPLYVTSASLEYLKFGYKGQNWLSTKSGQGRVPVDFTRSR